MSRYPPHPDTENFDVEDVPESIANSAIKRNVRLCECVKCGHKQYEIDTAGRNVRFSCDECGTGMML